MFFLYFTAADKTLITADL